MGLLWWQQAEPEEQGSFCDRDSQVTYDHKSWKETAGEAATHERSYYDDRSELGGRSDQANSALLEENDQGIALPAKHRVGGN
jgi:hypothetical protein